MNIQLLAAPAEFDQASVFAFGQTSGWANVLLVLFAILRWIVILGFAKTVLTRKSLAAWVLVSMVAGAEFGHDWPAVSVQLQIFGTIFLRLIKVIIAPLLFSTLVVGIAGHSDLRKAGRIALKALVFFEIVSALAMVIGFLAIQVTHPGIGVRLPTELGSITLDSKLPSLTGLITEIFPENIAKSVADGQLLQVVVFSILFGVALARVPESKRRPFVALVDGLSETMFKFTNLVMLVAPLGVFGSVAYTVGSMGLPALVPLAKLLGTMYAACAIYVLGVLLPIALGIRVPGRRFMKAITGPVGIAFGTASSEAALPRAMEEMEHLGVARETVAFVLPTGYSFNLAGSSLYQTMALLFVAEAAGIHLSFSQQIVMLLTLFISSKGTAGVARASIVIVSGMAASFHLPAQPILLLFGIDQLMDMARSAVNVLGNCLAAVVVARWEGETAPFVRGTALAADEGGRSAG